MSDAIWIALIVGVFAILQTWLQHHHATVLAKIQADNSKRLDDISSTGEKTHTLVNSSMGLQLRISSVALNRLAEITKNADDIAAAKLADQSYEEHVKKQTIVDAQTKARSDATDLAKTKEWPE